MSTHSCLLVCIVPVDATPARRIKPATFIVFVDVFQIILIVVYSNVDGKASRWKVTVSRVAYYCEIGTTLTER